MGSSFQQAHTISRPTGGAPANGRWAGESFPTIAITASHHPVTPTQRKNIPAGYDADSAILLITDTELRVAQAGSQNSDFLTFLSKRYDVVSVESWQNAVIPHYEVVVARPHQET